MAASDKALALNLAHVQVMDLARRGDSFTPEAVIDLAKQFEGYLDGSAERDHTERSQIETAARAAHEAIRALQIAHNEPGVALPWPQVAKDIRESCKIGVKRVIENPDIEDEELHNSWVETKKSQGYTYGPKRDDVLKQHHCMVPYNELSAHDRSKDLIFRSVVKAVLGL